MIAPISVCLIVKDEIGQIENCLKSIRPYVKEICIVDTGSTDGTSEVCKKYADKFEIYTECNDDQDRIESFSKARNRSFELASQPWTMWIDGDDEVQGAEYLDELINKYNNYSKPILIMLQYEYSHDDNGNVTCLHWRERLVQPKKDFEWVNPVHEILNPKISNTLHIRSEKVKIIHRRKISGKIIESGRNLRILKKHYDNTGESDVRSLYYLGLEYGNNGDIENALKFHKRYIELSGWDDERFQACLKIIEHYQSSGKYEEAIEWALKSLVIKEGWSEAYFALAKNYYFLAQQNGPNARRCWEKCIYFSELGFKIPPTETILFVNPIEREFEIHRYLNVAYNSIGLVEKALVSVDTALKIKSDPGLEHNKRLYEIHLAKTKIRKEFNILKEYNDTDGIRDIINLISLNNDNNKIESVEKISDNSKLYIVFYVGKSIEPWNPNLIEKQGIGGSEIAVWEVSRRLAAKGYKIQLYGDCSGELEGVFEGVEFLHFDKCRNLSCDVLITSRRSHIVDDEFNIKSKITLCWVHDIHCGSELTHTRALRIDKFLCLSDWHKNFFLNYHKFIHPNQMTVTRNGIDLTRFEASGIIRDPHRAVYSSSPDRGLEVAIKIMPKIREKIPDSELHVYYGFKNWEITAELRKDQGQINLIQRLKLMLEEHKQHGVYFHDRINQKQLAKEFLKAGVWMYPTWFSETSCQLAGSLVFTKDGMKPIEKIQIGDLVLTHKGRFRRVNKLIEKNYDGDIYKIKRKKNFNPIIVTEEHPLYTVSFHKNESAKGNRVYSHNNLCYDWKIPLEINIGLDYLFSPKMLFGTRNSILLSDYVDLDVKDGKICTNHNHPICKSEQNEIKLTEELMYLFGLFAAEGSCSKIKNRNNVPSAITYAFHVEETDLIEKVINRFGGEVVPNSENGVSVRFYHSVWGYFFINAIGTNREKRIPDFVWECSKELQTAFMNGMFDGDGYTSTSPKGNGKTTKPFYNYTSVSPSLAYGIAQLLTNNGIYPSITYCVERDNFDLQWSENSRNSWHQELDDGFATRIESIEVDHYEGKVYNFDVEEDESYITDRTAVHNCITAMEAQAAGLHIVTSPIAALNETVGERGVMIPGDWLSKEYQDKFVDAVVKVMNEPKDQDREEIHKYAKEHFGWDSLVDDWINIFNNVINETEINKVLPYKGVI